MMAVFKTMLDLTPRSDLAQLDDVALVERLNHAWQAHEAVKDRYGAGYYLNLFSWQPLTWVEDPREYIFPIHILSEIRDINAELKRRVTGRKQANNDPHS